MCLTRTHTYMCMLISEDRERWEGDGVEEDKEEEEKFQDEVVDWLFRPPAAHDGQGALGGWGPSACMLGATCLGYAGFGGFFFNLVLYLMREWGAAPADAANDVTNLLGTMFFTSLLGGLAGDAYVGRLWAVLLFLLLFLIGSVLVGVAAVMHAKGFLYGAMYVAAVGNGSYEPGLASLGGDQFDAGSEKTTFFNWFFVFSNVGQLLALSLLTYLENSGRWALSFWISAAFVFLALPVFFLALPFSRQFRPSGNPLLRIAQVLFCALKNANIPHATAVVPAAGFSHHSSDFRWLDKAAVVARRSDGELQQQEKSSGWSVCSVKQVEEVKCVIRIVPFVVAGVLFNTIIAQITTLFIVQGESMDGGIGSRFKIPPGSMQAFTVLTCILFAPYYDYVLVPMVRKRTGHEKGLTTLQRMGWGMGISVIAMLIAALVEKKRLQHNAVPISIYWLVPQYVILGISLVFTIVAQMDFFYTEVPDGMRSLGISLPLVCRGLGNYASTLVVTIVTRVTATRGGGGGWIPLDINRGHIDYFYWLLAVLMALTLIFYLIAAHFYTYRSSSRTHAQMK